MDLEKIVKNLLDKKAAEDNTIDLNAYAMGLEDLKNEMASYIMRFELPSKDDVYSEMQKMAELYFSNDNARNMAFGLGFMTGVNFVNKNILD